jgi:hypothetical protein
MSQSTNTIPSLTGVYSGSLNDEEKKEWNKLIKENPQEVLNTYHSAFCKNKENAGFCDLLQLFRLLGSLEERNRDSIIKKDVQDIKNAIQELKNKVIPTNVVTNMSEILPQTSSTPKNDDSEQLNKVIQELRKNIENYSKNNVKQEKVIEALNSLRPKIAEHPLINKVPQI